MDTDSMEEYNYHHEPRYSQADFELAIKQAYNQGWYACAGWAERDDLVPDVDSPAFMAERSKRLMGVGS